MSRVKRVELVRAVGDSIRYVGVAKVKATGAPFNLTGSTATADLIDGDGTTVDSWDVTLGNGTFTLVLTTAATTALGPGTWRWTLRITTAGEITTWIFGTLTLEDNT